MLDPHFKAMLDELAKIEMPPLAALPPEMVREGYRATRRDEPPAVALNAARRSPMIAVSFSSGEPGPSSAASACIPAMEGQNSAPMNGLS